MILKLVRIFNDIVVHLFEIVSNGEPALSRSKIISVIRMFDLPINIEEFFYPIGKKETLNFSEFCLLFKSNDRKDNVFLRSFTKGMKSGEKHNSSALNEKGSNFPIAVIKLK